MGSSGGQAKGIRLLTDVEHYSSFQINAQAVYTHNGVEQALPGSPSAALKGESERPQDTAHRLVH